MNTDELLFDYLDGLLDGDREREALDAIARQPARLAEVARRRALLYRPYPVLSPSAAPPEQLRARARARSIARLARYAAVFLLGVVTTLLLELLPARPTETTDEPAPEPAVVITNRRLR